MPNTNRREVNISFHPFSEKEFPLFLRWAEKPHVKPVWFAEGYEAISNYHERIKGNGYDRSFIIYLNDKPVGYIQASDLYAYRTICPSPKGVFTQEDPGSFCLDLFIGEEVYLNKGYGTVIVKQFIEKLFREFKAKKNIN